MSATPFLSISELALWVTDLERAVEFYCDGLGFAVVEIDPGRNAFLRSGDFLMVLFVPASPGPPLAEEYMARNGSPRGLFYHAALRLEPAALDGYAATLRERGVAVRGPVEFATGRRSYFVEDPDEHTFELTDR